MDQSLWDSVDDYLTSHLVAPDPSMNATLAANAAAELPAIDVTPLLGKLLHLLVRIHGAKNILEIGTLGGYSTTWLARALPADGKLLSLEVVPKHAEVARANLDRALVGSKVEVRLGSAAETLKSLNGPFDMIFIDADKESNPLYWAEAMRLSRPGSVIVVDNVVRNGAVADSASVDPSVRGVQKMLEIISNEPRVEASAVQTVGSKGYDGFLVALVV